VNWNATTPSEALACRRRGRGRALISLTALMGPTTLVSLVMVAVLVLPERANADKLPFGVTVFGGVSAGGGIYSASTSQGSVEWTSADGEEQFSGERLKTGLDESAFFGIRFGKGISDQFSWDLSLSHTQMNVSADVLTAARYSYTYNWDTVRATFYEAVLAWDWSKQKNTPYFLAGIGLSNVKFDERETTGGQLKQDGVSYVLGGGYRWEFVRFEARDHILPTDFSDEEARLPSDTFNGKNPLQFWEISVGFFLGF